MTDRGYPHISAEERVRPTGRETPRPSKGKREAVELGGGQSNAVAILCTVLETDTLQGETCPMERTL